MYDGIISSLLPCEMNFLKAYSYNYKWLFIFF
jgi:hypothetical protein